jgi:hypothetical protein
MNKITKREITLNDFLKVKKIPPFKKMRTDAKTVNFGTIFACTGPTLGRQMKGAGFSEDDCDMTMETFSLDNAYNTALMASNGDKDPVELKYIIVGNKLRELFFQTYPCLLERVTREQDFAMKHGYVRTWTGPIRHLSELRYIKTNNNGSVIGADKKLFSKMFAHLKNEASNSTIQTAEVYQAMPDATALHQNLKDWGFKTRLFNYIHDSFNLYLYRPERDVVYALLNELAQIARQPYYDLPQHIDIEEVDLDLDGNYFKHGKEISIEHYVLKDELDKWNKKYGTDLKFTNYVPIYGEVV